MLNTDGCAWTAVQSGGKRARRHLQRKQPLGGAFRGESGAVVAGDAREIVQRGNDVAGDLRIGFRVSGEQAVVGRNAAIGALRVENPASAMSSARLQLARLVVAYE